MTQQVIHPEADQQVTPQHRPTTDRPRGTREPDRRDVLEQFAWLVALVLVAAIVAIGYLTSRGDDPVVPPTVTEEQVQLQQEKETMQQRLSGQRQGRGPVAGDEASIQQDWKDIMIEERLSRQRQDQAVPRDQSRRPGGLLEGTE